MPGTRRPRPVTLTDVAARAGTSVATVSYVLNDGPRNVAPATRERVLAAIAELGYRPNRIARALRAKRTDLIGLIVPGTADPFFNDLASAVERAAFSAGYLTVVGNSDFQRERELALVRGLLATQVDGLVIVALGESDAVRSSITESGVPFVSLHHRPHGLGGPLVTVDNDHGARLATTHLLDHGHRAVACMTHEDDLGPVGDRFRGWRETLRARRRRSGTDLVVRSPIDRLSASRHFQRWYPSTRGVTAIFAATDELAIGVLHGAAALGVRVPDELAVIGFDGVPERFTTVPELATVVEPFDQLGATAVDLLRRGVRRTATHHVPVTIEPSSSCGCAAVARR